MDGIWGNHPVKTFAKNWEYCSIGPGQSWLCLPESWIPTVIDIQKCLWVVVSSMYHVLTVKVCGKLMNNLHFCQTSYYRKQANGSCFKVDTLYKNAVRFALKTEIAKEWLLNTGIQRAEDNFIKIRSVLAKLWIIYLFRWSVKAWDEGCAQSR